VIEFGQTHGLSRTASARFNAPAVVLTAAAVCLGALAITVLTWIRHASITVVLTGSPDGRWTFGRLGTELDAERNRLAHSPGAVRDGIHLGIGPQYFGWLGYALLGAAVVLAIVAAAPPSAVTAGARLLGVLISVVGIAATLFAIDLIRVDSNVVIRGAERPPGYLDYLGATGAGAWAMLAAFALTLIAVALPARRERY
jgi:hypothetical protein